MADELCIEPGTVLAAMPDLLDPNFMHAVLVICQHSPEGAYGLITNRATEFKVRDLLPEHTLLGTSDFPVHLGGPVDHSTLQFLHVVPERVPGGLCLDGKLWLGGELEALGRFLVEDPAQARTGVRLFLGYSGWGAGQLEGELRTGSWLPTLSGLDAVFGPADEAAWRRVVRSIGGPGRDLGSLPPDVSWN